MQLDICAELRMVMRVSRCVLMMYKLRPMHRVKIWGSHVLHFHDIMRFLQEQQLAEASFSGPCVHNEADLC